MNYSNIKYNTLDKIEISKSQCEKIMRWAAQITKSLDVRPSMEEGLIQILYENEENKTGIYFKVNNTDSVSFVCLLITSENTFHPLISVTFNKSFDAEKKDFFWEKDNIIKFKSPFSGEIDKELTDTLSSEALYIYYSIMCYIEFFRSKVEIREASVKHKEKKMKRIEKHNKYNPNNKIVLKTTKTIYTVSDNEIPKLTEKEKRKFLRRAESWSVIGHWRTYKSGKKIWIKPFTKGTGANKKTKIYKIEENNNV